MRSLLRSPWPGWAAAATLAALWLGRAEPTGPAPAPPTATAPAPPTRQTGAGTGASEATLPAPPLAALDACRQRLVRCRTPPPEGAARRGEPRGPTSPGAAAAGRGTSPPDGDPAAAPPDRQAEGERMLARMLGVPPAEARWLREYVCAVGDVRADTLDALRNALREDTPPDALAPVLDEARKQRRAVLDDLKARLGDERYDALRGIGGLGLLGGILEC